MNENTKAILAEIRRSIDSMTDWKKSDDADLKARGADAWEGYDGAWRILAVAWPLYGPNGELYGPPLRYGFDGTAIRLAAGLIVRLPRDLAELAVVRAKESKAL